MGMLKHQSRVSVLRASGRRRVSYSGRGHTWVQFVKEFLRTHPVCDRCGEPSSEFRYIKHHNGDESRLFDTSNMTALCADCHHGDSDRWYGNDRAARGDSVRSRGGGSESLGTRSGETVVNLAFFGAKLGVEMGIPGPTRKSQASLRLSGSNRAGQRSADAEVDAPRGRPRCPSTLDARAKAEWRHVTTQLEAMGILSCADRTMLAALCQAVSDYERATQILLTDGFTVAGRDGPKKHPVATVRADAFDRILKLSKEFGLTPSSRSRMSIVSANPRRDDAKQRFFKD